MVVLPVVNYNDVLGIAGPGLCAGYTDTCGVTWYGLFIPPNVDLQGAGATGDTPTVIERGADFGSTTWPMTMPLFTPEGNNVISGIEFTDDNDYLTGYTTGTLPTGVPIAATIQLGSSAIFPRIFGDSMPLTTSNVVITNNVFNKPYWAIISGGLPQDHIYITYNTLGGAFNTAILSSPGDPVDHLAPDWPYPYQPSLWQDTIVAYNTFYPSSFQATVADYNASGSGSGASNIANGVRADFSNNLADGTSTQYFYNSSDPKGWRDAFYFTTGSGMDMTLISQNRILCPGDKYGDGEAIGYEGTAAPGGVAGLQPVLAAAPWTDSSGYAGTAVTVQGSVVTQFNDNTGSPFDISANPTRYYQGDFWLQIVQGTGRGQWRKIKALSVGSTGSPTFTADVTPAFDVLPDNSSVVMLQRASWQDAIVSNTVIQTSDICTEQNQRQHAGQISWFASVADSAIEGNQQSNTEGILLYQGFVATGGPSSQTVLFMSHDEVRNNVIDGAYAWGSRGQLNGLQLSLNALGYNCNADTCPVAPPPTTGFGLVLAGNVVTRASGQDNDTTTGGPNGHSDGAIGLNAGGQAGVIDAAGLADWPLQNGVLIFSNTLEGISDSVSGLTTPLAAIAVDVAPGNVENPGITWRSTLYNNSCVGADQAIKDFGIGTTRYCPAGHAGSCECSGVTSVDVGVAATDVQLSLEPSAGVQLSATSFTTTGGLCDSSVNLCMLGSLPAGASVTVTVTATVPRSRIWPLTFSATHLEPDGVPANNSVTVRESVL